jgi:SAM-dependent methyltransferase
MKPIDMKPIELLHRTGEGNPLLAALGLDSGPLARVNLDVHAEDEMLLHYLNLHGGNRDQALVLYFDSGRRIWETLAAILRWRFGERFEERFGEIRPPGFQLLDFASGYGRVTRFAVLDVPPESLWVSDIYAGGVRFQEGAFGVHGIVSNADPARFPCDQTFDAIVVSSLFTHLPEVTFRSWLERLWGLLRPGGALVFSVHDRDLLAPGRELPPSGILFDAMSESGSLPTEQYGTTWVDEPFVRRMVEGVAPGSSAHRIPRGLLRFQDLWVVVPEAGADFSRLALRAEPEGFVEHCSLAGGCLRIAGWVVDRARRAAPRELRVSLDGETLLAHHDFAPRPDVGVLFPYERVEAAGWRVEAALPPGAADAEADPHLAVDVVDAEGEVSRLYQDRLSAARLRSALLDRYALEAQARRHDAALAAQRQRQEGEAAGLRGEIGGLQRRLAAMEASRFWKLREAWWRVKRAVGRA